MWLSSLHFFGAQTIANKYIDNFRQGCYNKSREAKPFQQSYGGIFDGFFEEVLAAGVCGKEE